VPDSAIVNGAYNANNWAPYDQNITIVVGFETPGTHSYMPTVTHLINGNVLLFNGGADVGNAAVTTQTDFLQPAAIEASAAPLALDATGTATLDFDWAYGVESSASHGSSGFAVVDSVAGTSVSWFQSQRISYLETSDGASSFNWGVIPDNTRVDRQTTLNFDFDAGTVSAAASGPSYDGFFGLFSNTLSLPATFDPDTLVLFNVGFGENAGAFTSGPGYDNIVVNSSIPEPASLALLAMGGLLLTLRRKR